jgi:hypothetical protein
MLQQISVWLPVDVIRLILADRLNVSRLLRDQLEILYGGELVTESRRQRSRLVEAAR